MPDSRSLARSVLVGLDGFLGVTALAGGLALVGGAIRADEWELEESVFGGYTIPGLALAGVGLLALAAALLVARRDRLGFVTSMLAGAAICVFEFVEVLTISFHWLQAFYAVVGVAMIALGWRLRTSSRGDLAP